MTSLSGTSGGGEPKSILKSTSQARKCKAPSLGDIRGALRDDTDLSFVELYEAARDENELLEFKNYELQFKIQELEQNQKRILSAICDTVTAQSNGSGQEVTNETPTSRPCDGESSAEEDEAAPATGGQEEQCQRAANPAELNGEQQCGNSARVTSPQPNGFGSRLELELEAELKMDVSAPLAAGARRSPSDSRIDDEPHQFGRRCRSPESAVSSERRRRRQRQDANESGALLSLAHDVGRRSPQQTNGDGRAAKVDLHHGFWHENIDNEQPSSCEPRHDKYAPPAGEHVARKTNRRSPGASDRKLADCEHDHLIEYNGGAQEAAQCSPPVAASLSSIESGIGRLEASKARQQEGGRADSPPPPPCVGQTIDSLASLSIAPVSDSRQAAAGQSLVTSTKSSAIASSLAMPQRAIMAATSSAAADAAAAVQPHLAPTKRPAGARIAVPVPRRAPPRAGPSHDQVTTKPTSARVSQSIGSSRANAGRHLKKTGARVTPSCALPQASSFNGSGSPLRVRSKSSLEQKSTGQSNKQQPRPNSSPKSGPRNASEHEGGVKKAAAGERWSALKPIGGGLSKAKSSGQLSSSAVCAQLNGQQSGQFVTHIPTLIVKSHASSDFRESGEQAHQFACQSSPMMRRIIRSRREPNQQLANSAQKSKSLNNLAPRGGGGGGGGGCEEDTNEDEPDEEEAEGEGDEGEVGEVSENGAQNERESGRVLDETKADGAPATDAVAVAVVAADGEKESAAQESFASAQSADHVTGGALGQERPVCVPPNAPGSSVLANVRSSDNQRQAIECAQCQSYQLKLESLMGERERLSEQLSELEELENDSRLMSQNLAQQMLALERKFDKCQSELKMVCESESKLRFQNKRLHFELRQRQDCVGQLEYQMNELRSRARTLVRHQRDSAARAAHQHESESEAEAASRAGAADDQTSAGTKCHVAAACTSADDSDGLDEELNRRLRQRQLEETDPIGNKDKAPLLGAVSYDSAYSKSSCSSASSSSDSASCDASSSTNSEADCSEETHSSGCLAVGGGGGITSAGHESELSWANEQQVLKKRIATARILRGIQVQGGPAELNGRECDRDEPLESRSMSGEKVAHNSNELQLPKAADECATLCAPKDCPKQLQQQQQQQQHLEPSLLENIGTKKAAPAQEKDANTPLKERQSATLVDQTQTQTQTPSPMRQQQNQRARNAIRMALEGIDGLEKARDRELSKFLDGQQEAAVIKVAIVTDDGAPPSGTNLAAADLMAGAAAGRSSEKVNENGGQAASAAHDNEPCEIGTGRNCALGQLIDGLKHEVSSLKMRLVQANTLNDNLIMELKSQRSNPLAAKGQPAARPRPRSLSLDLQSQLEPNPQHNQAHKPQAVGELNNLAPAAANNPAPPPNQWSKEQLAPLKSHIGTRAPDHQLDSTTRRRSSVIYVNGLSASVTHHHHHYDRLQQQQTMATTQSQEPESGQVGSLGGQRQSSHHFAHQHNRHSPSFSHSQEQPMQLAGCINCYQRHQSDRYSAPNMQQQQQQQLLEWLRFLLDKLHFHHGRTFELLNECQKFAMNALLASYNHQVNLFHHQRVVAAGNQAARRLEQQQEHVATGRILIENSAATMDAGFHPVRPPPRRRAALATNRALDQMARDEMDSVTVSAAAAAAAAAANCANLETAPQHRLATDDASSSAVSALQVAKQSSFSLVPINYSANKQQHRVAADEQLRFCLEQRQRLLDAQDKQANCIANNEQPAPLLPTGKSNDIYAIVKKANKRQEVEASVSMEQSGNQAQRQSGPHFSTNTRLNVEPTTTTTTSSQLQLVLSNQQQQQQQLKSTTTSVFKTINQQQQQLAEVRNSLSEDMERFRVQSNGQLLDLLVRQNWCESVITEKIKSIEMSQRVSIEVHHRNNHAATPSRPVCGLPNIVQNS